METLGGHSRWAGSLSRARLDGRALLMGRGLEESSVRRQVRQETHPDHRFGRAGGRHQVCRCSVGVKLLPVAQSFYEMLCWLLVHLPLHARVKSLPPPHTPHQSCLLLRPDARNNSDPRTHQNINPHTYQTPKLIQNLNQTHTLFQTPDQRPVYIQLLGPVSHF